MNASAQPERICSECGEILPDSLRIEHCPACLLGLGLKAAESESAAVSQAAGAPDPGEFFGEYELLERIGEGGMGIVYKARQRKLNRVVALKVMRSGSFASPRQIRRFRSEAQAAAQLSHLNVVAIHEVGEINGRPYFTMEFVAGQNLAQIIKRTPLAPERAARYLRQIAEAIRYAHSRGVLHRDLKPANVLIDESDHARVTDFGLAKLIDDSAEDSSEGIIDVTQSGAVLGTPSYMPPEQAQGRRSQIGPHSDVYSLGAILYDCLTGRPPFRADTPLDTLRQVVETDVAPPRLVNPKVPRDIETICLKCLAKESEARYATAQELADDLDRFITNRPIQARPIGVIGRGIRWARRNPVLAGVSAALAGLMLMLAWAALVQREYAMVNVKEAASLTARFVDDELKPIKSAVHELAVDPRLAAHMTRQDTNALAKLLQAHLAKYQPNTPAWLQFQNWLVISPRGAVILRWPEAEKNLNRECSVRDYFQGALTNQSVHVSRAYQSVDDNRYKFSLSQAVRDDAGKVAGVIALMVSPTDLARQALGPRTAGREVVLISEWDSSQAGPTVASLVPRGPREFRIVYHPTYKNESLALPIKHPHLDRLSDTRSSEPIGDSFFRDPLGKKFPTYRGWWLAGFANVPDSKIVLLYQTRDWVIDALAVAAAICAIVSGVLALSWRARHRRK